MALRDLVAVSAFAFVMFACGSETTNLKSITGPDYQGQKYYFGWGLNGNGDEEMDNEVKYDVLHTHDIFTKDVGGDYIGTKLIGEDQVSGSKIKTQWRTLTNKMKSNDMYLQYSSGHGYPGGLAAGVNYTDIVNAALGMPAQEVVIFTMACYSGGLVDAFDEAKTRWQDYPSKGKTLFVMASSTADQESSTGPGNDVDEPNGPDGSAGSAFGHALWKAIIGYADKTQGGGNGDGMITLGEIIDYVVKDTQDVQQAVYTGAYNRALQIAKVPSYAEAKALLGDTEEGRKRLQTLVDDDVLRY